MTIGTCDNCSRENVPVSHLEGTYCGDTTQCFLCQGDGDEDPYGEIEQYDAHLLAFRWHQHCWMAREYRHAGERFGS